MFALVNILRQHSSVFVHQPKSFTIAMLQSTQVVSSDDVNASRLLNVNKENRSAVNGTDSTVSHQPTTSSSGGIRSSSSSSPLPRMNHTTGGVIVFFHVNKAGGTTLQYHLSRLGDDVVYTFAQGGHSRKAKANLKFILSSLERWATRTTAWHRIYIHEIHSSGNPSFADLYPKLRRWKASFRRRGIPFFAFTVIREPLSHLLSAFNFICIQNRRCHRFRRVIQQQLANRSRRFHHDNAIGGVDDLLLLSHPNLQCRYFVRQWLALAFDDEDDGAPTADECQTVYRDMTEFFDWVGRVEAFEDTLRVLQGVLGGRRWNLTTHDDGGGRRNKTPQHLPGIVRDGDLTRDVRDRIYANLVDLDVSLYARVQRDYTLERMGLEGR